MLVGVSDNYKCVSVTHVSVCVCVCVSFFLICFKLSSGCLLSSHHVNQGGGVQKHTSLFSEESHRRRRSDRHSQELDGHVGHRRHRR
jgi:hypothetical protein